jgi:hypothetical protein
MLNERDKSANLSIIEREMKEPPYHFTFEEICQFKNERGQNIAQDCSQREIEAYLKQRQKTDGNLMPPILIFHGPKKEIWYVKKEKVVDLCDNIIVSALPVLKVSLEDRWRKMIQRYQTENTMNDDVVFDQLIDELASIHVPHLIPIVRDSKMEFILEEQKDRKLPVWADQFYSSEPVILRKLFGFKRNVILHSVYAELPFWYSNKIIKGIIGFIKHGSNRVVIFKKTARPVKANSDNNASAKIDWIIKNLLTKSGSIDSELDALAESWNQLLERNSRQKLRKDVDAIVNAKISYEMKTFNFGNLSISVIEDIAESLIISNNTLDRIPNKKALRKYIMLIILRRLQNKRSGSVRTP